MDFNLRQKKWGLIEAAQAGFVVLLILSFPGLNHLVDPALVFAFSTITVFFIAVVAAMATAAEFVLIRQTSYSLPFASLTASFQRFISTSLTPAAPPPRTALR